MKKVFRGFNWKLALLTFVIVEGVLFTTGCGWISEVQSLLPDISAGIAAVMAIISGLLGKTIPQAFETTATNIENAVGSELTNLSNAIAEYEKTKAPGTIATIQAVLKTISDSLSSFVSGLKEAIPDTATVDKIAQLVAVIVTAVSQVLAAIPSTSALLAASSPAKLKVLGEHLRLNIHATHASYKKAFNAVLDDPTGNVEVDAVVAKVKRL